MHYGMVDLLKMVKEQERINQYQLINYFNCGRWKKLKYCINYLPASAIERMHC